MGGKGFIAWSRCCDIRDSINTKSLGAASCPKNMVAKGTTSLSVHPSWCRISHQGLGLGTYNCIPYQTYIGPESIFPKTLSHPWCTKALPLARSPVCSQETEIKLPPVPRHEDPQHEDDETPRAHKARSAREEAAKGQDRLHIEHEAIRRAQQPEGRVMQKPQSLARRVLPVSSPGRLALGVLGRNLDQKHVPHVVLFCPNQGQPIGRGKIPGPAAIFLLFLNPEAFGTAGHNQ